MNILNRLTIKNLKLNKKRTIVTIIGIILSTALICAVAGMVSSFQQTLVNTAIIEGGNRHITILDVTGQDLKYFENNKNVKKMFLTENLGYAPLVGSINKNKPYVYIKSYTKEAFENTTIELVSGRLPQSPNEIVISKTIISDAEVELKVGDYLKLDIGTRTCSDGSSLDQNNPIFVYDEEKTEEIDTCQEHLNYKYSKEYKIVGIMQRPNYSEESYTAPGYTVITYTDNITTDSIDVSLLFNDASYYKTFINNLINSNNLNDYNYMSNEQLLRWSGVSLSDNTMSMLYTVAAVVIAIIIGTSIFVIKNSFDISITEKTKQYGMLSSIGATSRQIKKNVLYEGFILGIIGIPLGILCGIFADFVLVKIINIIGASFFNDIEFAFKVPLLPIILSAGLAAITIFLSVIHAARRSSKISPIEAIRNNNEIKITKKKLKTPKIINKLFGIGGEIAYKNLKRSRKKYRTTVISIVVSITVFITLSTFISYGFKLTGQYYQNVDYNVKVNIYSKNESDLESIKKAYNEIKKLDNINSYALYKRKVVDFDSFSFYNNQAFKYIYGMSKEELSKKDNPEEYLITSLELVSLNQEEYKKYVKKLGGNIEDYKNKVILYDKYIVWDETNKKYRHIDLTDFKAQDTITLYPSEEKSITLTIAKKTDILPMGITESYSQTGYMIISEELMEELNGEYTAIYIDSSNPDKLEKAIKTYFLNNPKIGNSYVYNLDSEAKAQNSLIILVSIFLYGFIIVISLIGVTNIFNTITTNMNLRKKEFAMLKSIGMTKKEFNKMVRLESIFYTAKSLIIGIPLGILGSYAIYKAFASGNDMNFSIPFIAVIIAIIVVFTLVNLIMYFGVKKINKQNIIETIRNDNI